MTEVTVLSFDRRSPFTPGLRLLPLLARLLTCSRAHEIEIYVHELNAPISQKVSIWCSGEGAVVRKGMVIFRVKSSYFHEFKKVVWSSCGNGAQWVEIV